MITEWGIHASIDRRPVAAREAVRARRQVRALGRATPAWRLQRDGWQVNCKRVRRLHRLEGVAVRRRKRKL